MTRRRMMLEQKPEYVVTFEDLKQMLLDAGESEGVDTTGYYVTNSGNKTPQYVPIMKDFKRNTNHEVYIKSNTTGSVNLGYRIINNQGEIVGSVYTLYNGQIIPQHDVTKHSVYSICGQWYTGSFKIYDFHIKEI